MRLDETPGAEKRRPDKVKASKSCLDKVRQSVAILASCLMSIIDAEKRLLRLLRNMRAVLKRRYNWFRSVLMLFTGLDYSQARLPELTPAQVQVDTLVYPVVYLGSTCAKATAPDPDICSDHQCCCHRSIKATLLKLTCAQIGPDQRLPELSRCTS